MFCNISTLEGAIPTTLVAKSRVTLMNQRVSVILCEDIQGVFFRKGGCNISLLDSAIPTTLVAKS